MKIVFWLSIFLICYVYLVYIIALRLCLIFFHKGKSNTNVENSHFQPNISVIISAFNEETVIDQRIENFLYQNYPDGKIEIIVASDGSTDRTFETTRHHENSNVRVLDFKEKRGRAAIQNDAMAMARGDIVVFTDAETKCDKDFLKEISVPFDDREVGCAVGNLVYENKDTGISASEGLYWQFEKKLRELESKLGILATGTGACMAVRRDLYRPLSPIDDCDFTTPLDVVLQGYRVVYAPDAIAYDIPASTIRGEFRTRVRQTSKNLIGTLKRWELTNWLDRPAISWGLLSHKILRWLTPFSMAGVLLSNFFLLDEPLYKYTMIIQGMFYLAGGVGLVMNFFNKKVPVLCSIFSFCVACLGIGIGVIKGLAGKAPATYESAEQSQ